ncbi:tail fiber domain-containing protein [Ramlibacter sp.]|uniref:tail fiber domain-containing protein n=1 Tax=Ramlibacter sp. TaxID=1917967 RepID=UPI003D0F4180
MCSDAPDTSGVNAAALRSAELGEKALSWWQDAEMAQRPLREAAAARAGQVSDAQLRAMDTSTAIALEQSERAKRFHPVEDAILKDAMGAGGEAEQEAAAGRAVNDVSLAFGNQRGTVDRNLRRSGLGVSDTDRAMVEGEMGAAEALATAGAATRARQGVITLADAKKKDAAAMGRGMMGTQATQAGIALNQGNSSVANAQLPVSLAAQGAQVGAQGFQTALTAQGQAGNLYGQAAKLGQEDDSGLWGAVGGLAGKALFATSDEKQKEDVSDADGEVALRAVRKMPVKQWKYRKDSPAADGGKEHVGPMAQAVQATLGDRAAPEGKAVDVITLAGTALAAVKELDQKVTTLAKRRA